MVHIPFIVSWVYHLHSLSQYYNRRSVYHCICHIYHFICWIYLSHMLNLSVSYAEFIISIFLFITQTGFGVWRIPCIHAKFVSLNSSTDHAPKPANNAVTGQKEWCWRVPTIDEPTEIKVNLALPSNKWYSFYITLYNAYFFLPFEFIICELSQYSREWWLDININAMGEKFLKNNLCNPCQFFYSQFLMTIYTYEFYTYTPLSPSETYTLKQWAPMFCVHVYIAKMYIAAYMSLVHCTP